MNETFVVYSSILFGIVFEKHESIIIIRAQPLFASLHISTSYCNLDSNSIMHTIFLKISNDQTLEILALKNVSAH